MNIHVLSIAPPEKSRGNADETRPKNLPAQETRIDVREFDELARTVFRPVYPVIAAWILVHTGVTSGNCLDIGCGGGYLGLELARQSALEVSFLDRSGDMLDMVRRNLAQEGLSGRGRTILAPVESIPLPDRSLDLAVSRGSVFFWEDHAAAFREIYRVLAPGGVTCVGGGFGSAVLREEIGRRLLDRGRDGHDKWRLMVRRNLGPDMLRKLLRAVGKAGIPACELVDNEEQGLWIVIRRAG